MSELDAILLRLNIELAEMRQEDRGLLGQMDPDTAFESGYAAAVADLRRLYLER